MWIRYHEDAIPSNAFTKATGFSMPLTKVSLPLNLLNDPGNSLHSFPTHPSALTPLPIRCLQILSSSAPILPSQLPAGSSAWWNRPATAQPLENRCVD